MRSGRSFEKPKDGAEQEQKRRRTIHLPSVDPGCYVALRSLDLGKYENCVSKLAERKSWKDLKRMLHPVADVVVKDALGSYFVDGVRRQFDSYEEGKDPPFIVRVMSCNDTSDVEILKMLLAVGLNPDLTDRENRRPSHWCGRLSRVDLAAVIFPCRPCMLSRTRVGVTPVMAASGRNSGDVSHPERIALRRDVYDYIKNGGFESRFPTLPELAVRKAWFAVKNLLRRGVVAESEFVLKVQDKTAADWAQSYKEFGIAKEINYYATSLSTRFEAAAKQMTAITEKFCQKEDSELSMSLKIAQLQKQNKELKQETIAGEAQIEGLLEAMTLFRTKLEGAGIACDWDEAMFSRRNAARSVSSFDSGCDNDSRLSCIRGTSADGLGIAWLFELK